MSIEQVEEELKRFLSSDENEVICLSGPWGVGKTYAWNAYLRSANSSGSIALPRYSYVSLFGLNSLDEFKYAIFENTFQRSEIEAEPTLETLRSNATAIMERLGRKTTWFLQQLPWVKNHVGGLGPVWFLSVKKTIVCVDDIERRGEGLRIRDVFGLISQLKERKQCKVILILNEEALQKDKDDFQLYYEKVVDASLKFTPTADECVRIALQTQTQEERLLAEACVTLGISNIRIIKKVERLVAKIRPIIVGFDDFVLTQAVKTIALFAWSKYDAGNAPSVGFIMNRGKDRSYSMTEKVQTSATDAAWNALLDVYEFATVDDFDLVLLDGVTNGFFDTVQVRERATELDQKVKAYKLDASFKDAWGLYHDSFSDNEIQVVDAIYQASIRNISKLSIVDLNSTVTVLKSLNQSDLAEDILKRYVESSSSRQKFDLATHPFRQMVTDVDVVKGLNTRFAAIKDPRTPAEILMSLVTSHGWTPGDIRALSTLPTETYRKIFKQRMGSELHLLIQACLQFDRIGNASDEMREISKRAKEALRLIGNESRINAARVSRYCIDVTENQQQPGSVAEA